LKGKSNPVFNGFFVLLIETWLHSGWVFAHMIASLFSFLALYQADWIAPDSALCYTGAAFIHACMQSKPY
jgi:hypothetical protein